MSSIRMKRTFGFFAEEERKGFAWHEVQL